ncbi:hypothetical protein JTE90_017384 [Oedothorax gibbosus]|uniref:Uncharacterized protein n=1 Tax=Oedothorax gibbosus TaxID=931172 RepID=A0AAV6VS67_9ARAC|nr:hypothetical protein JTE90_017384 [Oedothorax gibbosus]
MILKTLLFESVLLFAVFRSGLTDQHILESCYYHEICVEEDGIAKAMECVSKISQLDKDMVVETFSKFFPEATTVELVISDCCKDREKSIKAVTHYYDTKIKAEVTGERTLEDRKKMIEARGCLMLMVEECRTKKVMGLID